jgi:uncharacterized protein with HEPN domain
MDNVKDDRYYLNKIVDDVSFVIDVTKDLSLDEFLGNELINSAVNFKFVQISESASKLSENVIVKNSDIPWQKIKGLRNRIVHDYENVFLDVLYNTIKNDFPQFLSQIKGAQV